MRCLGLDAGINHTGWAVITHESQKLACIANGTIRPKSTLPLAQRLAALHEGIQRLIDHYTPTAAAVEQTFVNRNGKSTLILGQARGVVLMSPALRGLDVAEYPANTVKKAVAGYGHADKAQIQAMLALLVPGITLHSADAADACAVAICHMHHFSFQPYRSLT